MGHHTISVYLASNKTCTCTQMYLHISPTTPHGRWICMLARSLEQCKSLNASVTILYCSKLAFVRCYFHTWLCGDSSLHSWWCLAKVGPQTVWPNPVPGLHTSHHSYPTVTKVMLLFIGTTKQPRGILRVVARRLSIRLRKFLAFIHCVCRQI